MNRLLRLLFTLAYKIKRKWDLLKTAWLTEVVNRYHLVNMKSCGEEVKLYGDCLISGQSSIELGSNIHIGENAFIRGEGGLTIGNNVRISRNFTLYTINHNYEGETLPYDAGYLKKRVTIGKNVWIGMNVTVLPGAEIGEGAIVGAGTVVTGKVPSLAIIGGQRWRILKMRDEEHYGALDT